MMQRVKDQAGNIIPGLMKSNTGNLVVSNQEQYYKYVREKQSIEKINSLEKEVQQLKELIQTLLEKTNG